MSYLDPDSIKLKILVESEISRDSAHRRGRKRDSDKIFHILYIIMQNDLDGHPPLSTQNIIKNLPEYNVNDIEEHLQYLTKFPENAPFLLKDRVYRMEGDKRLPGGPFNVYRLNREHLARTGRAHYQLDTILVK